MKDIRHETKQMSYCVDRLYVMLGSRLNHLKGNAREYLDMLECADQEIEQMNCLDELRAQERLLGLSRYVLKICRLFEKEVRK